MQGRLSCIILNGVSVMPCSVLSYSKGAMGLMGRKPEFKVSKAFTIGLQEAGFLAEKSRSMGMKASQYINWLLRQEMLEERNSVVRKPQAYCCEGYTGFDLVKDRWVCEKCNRDRTDYIKAIVERTR